MRTDDLSYEGLKKLDILHTKTGTYRNIPVYDDFNYEINNQYDGYETLSPVWTASGMLIPITHSVNPAYMRIPRKECIKMLNDLLCLDECLKILDSCNQRTTIAIDKE